MWELPVIRDKALVLFEDSLWTICLANGAGTMWELPVIHAKEIVIFDDSLRTTWELPAILFDDSFWPGLHDWGTMRGHHVLYSRMPVLHLFYSFYGLLAFLHFTENITAGVPRILFSCQNDVTFHQRAWGHLTFLCARRCCHRDGARDAGDFSGDSLT